MEYSPTAGPEGGTLPIPAINSCFSFNNAEQGFLAEAEEHMRNTARWPTDKGSSCQFAQDSILHRAQGPPEWYSEEEKQCKWSYWAF
ncbi:hypothetical protein Y1Q_0002385 [Alligator mississippiensis]|uniref:Uncharacterized protein n=1 Tax=Alligator mississippiensis TaxID=8496 RepID=A0A151MGX2_ALLMI|nr:hypothetical protein Y1Q_0002385 [Alligator mississippiensis]